MDELLDELPLGVLFLDDTGHIGRSNPVARQLLESPIGAEVARTLEKMVGRAASTGQLVEAVMTAGAVGELRLLLARSDQGSGFVVYIERSSTSRLRAEIQILRALLEAVTNESSPGNAIGPGLASLASTLSSGWVALFEKDESAQRLHCIAHVNVPPEHLLYLAPHNLSAGGSALARAAVSAAPFHVSLLSRAPFPTERAMAGGDKLAGLALPVRNGGKTLGAIFVCGPVGILGAGEIRLVQALADAVGALLARSHRDQSILRGAQEKKKLTADVSRARDVTVQRERMALLGQLAAAITHEINNPLAFVRSNIELVESMIPAQLVGSSAERTEMVRDALRDSLQGLDRVGAIITALKGMARRNIAEPVEFDPQTPVREALLIFERARQAAGKVKLTLPALPRAWGSPGALAQVLLNLLDNALDATAGKGPIEVSVCAEEGGIALRVGDRGCGLSEEARAHLFEPYFTTKEAGKGTGLGLYLSRDMLAATGATIELEPVEGATVFRVFIKAATN